MSIELVGGQLYQWETGRQLMIAAGASEANAIQFANQGDTTALEIEQNFTMEDGDIYVKIPDKCLQSAKNLLVYLVYNEASENSDEHKSRIFATKIFPVTAKPRPKNYIPIAAEEALGVVRRLTAAAQEAAGEAEEHRIHAQTAREVAETARDKAILEKQAAETARKGAEDARNAAVTAKDAAEASADTAADWGEAAEVAARSAENHEAFSYENSQAAADSKTKAEKAKGDAQSAATKAENAKATAVQEAEKAKTQAANAKNSADSAAAAAEVAGDAAESSAVSAGNAGVHAESAEAAKEAAQAAAETAAEEATRQILSDIGAELDKKAEIDDTTTGQNAWSSNNIVDKLCPTTEAKGTSAIFNGIPGAPLHVIVSCSDEDQKLMLVYSGKNLYDRDNYPLTEGRFINYKTGALSTSGSYCATEDYIPIGHLCGRTITLNNIPGGTNPGMAFYDAAKGPLHSSFNGKGNNIVVPNEAYYMRFCIDNTEEAKKYVQIELGSGFTGFKDFAGGSITKEINKDDFVDFDEKLDGFVFDEVKAINEEMVFGGYSVGQILDTSWQLVESITGVSQVKVIGKSSPAVAIENLYNIIKELKTALIGQGANI